MSSLSQSPPTSSSSTSKRGRKRDDTLPPNRARDVQRAFRARRASHLEALEQRVIILEDENARLRAALDLPPSDRPPLGTGPTGRGKLTCYMSPPPGRSSNISPQMIQNLLSLKRQPSTPQQSHPNPSNQLPSLNTSTSLTSSTSCSSDVNVSTERTQIHHHHSASSSTTPSPVSSAAVAVAAAAAASATVSAGGGPNAGSQMIGKGGWGQHQSPPHHQSSGESLHYSSWDSQKHSSNHPAELGADAYRHSIPSATPSPSTSQFSFNEAHHTQHSYAPSSNTRADHHQHQTTAPPVHHRHFADPSCSPSNNTTAGGGNNYTSSPFAPPHQLHSDQSPGNLNEKPGLMHQHSTSSAGSGNSFGSTSSSSTTSGGGILNGVTSSSHSPLLSDRGSTSIPSLSALPIYPSHSQGHGHGHSPHHTLQHFSHHGGPSPHSGNQHQLAGRLPPPPTPTSLLSAPQQTLSHSPHQPQQQLGPGGGGSSLGGIPLPSLHQFSQSGPLGLGLGGLGHFGAGPGGTGGSSGRSGGNGGGNVGGSSDGNGGSVTLPSLSFGVGVGGINV